MDRKLKLANCIKIEIEELKKATTISSSIELANQITTDAMNLADLILQEEEDNNDIDKAS